MARVKLQFPKKSLFKTSLDISINHINYGNHVGNEHFLSFCHETRLRFLRSIDQDELNFYGSSLIMADAEISYKAQVYHGDIISVELFACETNPKSFEFYYLIKNQDDQIVCQAKTGMVYFNYDENKVVSCPKEWSPQII